MITEAVLDICQTGPCQPGEGTIEPFSAAELAAVERYNQATEGLDEVHLGVPDDVLRHQVEAGEAAIAEVQAAANPALDSVYDRYDALDALDSDLRDGEGRHSNAAVRLLEHEANLLVGTTNRVLRGIAYAAIGRIGPVHVVADGHLLTSNGHLALDGTAAG